MAIGLSTYAFFWRGAACMKTPMPLEQMLEETARLGGEVFQICDYPAIEQFDANRLTALARLARTYNITLELGTRGLGYTHLERYLRLAEQLEVSMLRSMFNSENDRPDEAEAIDRLGKLIPRLEQQNVMLALETYEQVPLETLMRVVEAVDSARVGICLDPGNCVAALSMPQDVIECTAARVINLHVKDFAFSRAPGWVGFQLTGCPLGEGLLPFDDMIARVAPYSRGINLIIEHWLPWQQDEATTQDVEAQWTRHGMAFLRSRYG